MYFRPILSIALLVSLLLIAACSSTGESAEEIVIDYLEAKVEADGEGIQMNLCAALEGTLDREARSFAGVEATLQNASCVHDTDTNIVECQGEIVAVYGGENRQFPLASYNVVQEDGVWKWCGEAIGS